MYFLIRSIISRIRIRSDILRGINMIMCNRIMRILSGLGRRRISIRSSGLTMIRSRISRLIIFSSF